MLPEESVQSDPEIPPGDFGEFVLNHLVPKHERLMRTWYVRTWLLTQTFPFISPEVALRYLPTGRRIEAHEHQNEIRPHINNCLVMPKPQAEEGGRGKCGSP